MSVFVDSSIWFAAANTRDAHNKRAKHVLKDNPERVTSDYVVVETWRLLHHRISWSAAETFWSILRQGAATIEHVTFHDLEVAWSIGLRYPDQEFSLTDRTSFAMMERLGIRTAATFDSDFAVYRFGRRNSEAFEVLR